MKQLWLCIALAACGGSSAPKQDTTTTQAPPAKTGDPTCPLEVPGTSLSVEDTTAGAALVFVTTGDAAAVQMRATALATMHTNQDGQKGAMGMMFTPTSTATASNIEGGARIEFAAKNPADASKVQSELRMHANHLTGGSCAM